MRAEWPGHTLPPTVLVPEDSVRLVGVDAPLEDRVHFLSLADRMMRSVLVDHAGSGRRARRGSGAAKGALDQVVLVSPEPSSERIDLDEALTRLVALDERKACAFELHRSGGLTGRETAGVIGVSSSAVDRDPRIAKMPGSIGRWSTSETGRSTPGGEAPLPEPSSPLPPPPNLRGKSLFGRHLPRRSTVPRPVEAETMR